MPHRVFSELRIAALSGALLASAAPGFSELVATWTPRGNVAKLPAGPGARQWHKLIYDSARKKVVLFGGSSGYYNDIWHYDTALDQWTEIEPWVCPVVFGFTPPLGRDDFSFEYDEHNGFYWLHGGGGYKCNKGSLSGVTQSGTTGLSIVMGPEIPVQTDDFYEDFTVIVGNKKAYVTSYASATHSVGLASAIPNLQPGLPFKLHPQRGGGTFFYDPSNGEWTGFDGPHWGYSGPNPASRTGAGSAYSTEARALVLFGGLAGRTDTWVMDVQQKSWTQVIGNGTTNAPFARGEFTNGMVYDRQHDKVVLFGGRCMDSRCTKNASLNDTWVYDLFTNTWTRMSPALSPPRRANHMMAYDSVNNVTVLFGGRDESGVIYADLWVYDYGDNRCTQLFPAESPSARRMGSLVHDPDQNLFVLYGGGAKSGLRDVWILRLQDVSTSPPD